MRNNEPFLLFHVKQSLFFVKFQLNKKEIVNNCYEAVKKFLYYYYMELKRIGFIATATFALGAISCADLPKTGETRYSGERESYTSEDFESLDEATRKETEYKADSIIKKYNTKFVKDCTPYSEDQINSKKNKRLDCVTFK